MSEILARIRVRETAGIRRFLYPLTAYVNLPPKLDTSCLQLATLDSNSIPLQVTQWNTGEYRIDFAVSLAPLQDDTDFLLSLGTPMEVPDPLQLTRKDGDKLLSVQERFEATLGPLGEFGDVVYDGIPHLSDWVTIRRPDWEDKNFKRGLFSAESTPEMSLDRQSIDIGGGPLAAWSKTTGVYADGCAYMIGSEITACKSWVMRNYRLEQPRPSEVIYFYLPLGGDFALGIPSRTTFDCGVNGIYGHVNYWGSFLNWFAPTQADDFIRWEIGRNYVVEDDLENRPPIDYNVSGNRSPLDYTGTTAASEFQQQRWFHLMDGTKAIAVAITKIPDRWKSLKVTLRGRNIKMEVMLSEDAVGPAEFGVCYHFLNDVPAIAAATNPQSILLPPVVEVLPV